MRGEEGGGGGGGEEEKEGRRRAHRCHFEGNPHGMHLYSMHIIFNYSYDTSSACGIII